MININGISIDYRGQGSGVAVIFLHAFPLDQTMWDDQLAVLHNHCRTITLDLRGFGQSDAPHAPYLKVIVGSEDTLTPVAEAESLRNGIKGAKLRLIDGAGHLSNMEQPQEFNAVLIEFIESMKQAF